MECYQAIFPTWVLLFSLWLIFLAFLARWVGHYSFTFGTETLLWRRKFIFPSIGQATRAHDSKRFFVWSIFKLTNVLWVALFLNCILLRWAAITINKNFKNGWRATSDLTKWNRNYLQEMEKMEFLGLTHSQIFYSALTHNGSARNEKKRQKDVKKSMHKNPKAKQKFCTKQFEFRTSEAICLNCAPNWSFNDVYRRILIARLTTEPAINIYHCVYL